MSVPLRWELRGEVRGDEESVLCGENERGQG